MSEVTNAEMDLLASLGIHVSSLDYNQQPVSMHSTATDYLNSVVDVEIRGEFLLDQSRFRSMLHLIRLTNMIVESKNPSVEETYHHLITLLELTK